MSNQAGYRRSLIQAFNDHLTKPVETGAEVGVFRGDLSIYLLENVKTLNNLILVDPWKTWEEETRYAKQDHKWVLRNDPEDIFQETKEKIASHTGRYSIMRSLSLEAVKDVPDLSLDFVFIDADHSYEGCKEDIYAWKPKVRRGGLLCGHDYGRRKWGVKRAVDEYAKNESLGLQIYPRSVWAILIPE